jgi:hypothetical protein
MRRLTVSPPAQQQRDEAIRFGYRSSAVFGFNSHKLTC